MRGYNAGGKDPEGPDPLENHKFKLKDSLAILVRIPCKITKLPSQYSMLGHYRPASETPLKWRFAVGPIIVHF